MSSMDNPSASAAMAGTVARVNGPELSRSNKKREQHTSMPISYHRGYISLWHSGGRNRMEVLYAVLVNGLPFQEEMAAFKSEHTGYIL